MTQEDIARIVKDIASPKDVIMPEVKVVTSEGQKTSIDDYDSFMQFLMMASMTSQLVRIRKYFDDKTPTGAIQTWALSVTSTRVCEVLAWDAQSVSFINDGPDTGYIWINRIDRPPHTIKHKEIFNVNFEVHKLKKFYHRCDPGNTASIRVVAKD